MLCTQINKSVLFLWQLQELSTHEHKEPPMHLLHFVHNTMCFLWK